jgi:hypothetical protein
MTSYLLRLGGLENFESLNYGEYMREEWSEIAEDIFTAVWIAGLFFLVFGTIAAIALR